MKSPRAILLAALVAASAAAVTGAQEPSPHPPAATPAVEAATPLPEAEPGHEQPGHEPAPAGAGAHGEAHGESHGAQPGTVAEQIDAGALHTAEQLAEHGGHDDKFDVLHHIMDSGELDVPLLPFLGSIQLPRPITRVMVWMTVAALFLIAVFAYVRKGHGLIPRGLNNMLEVLVLFVRDEIAVKNIGAHHAGPFVPYLLTLFFFILICNLLGLLPGGVTATGNINVTATLAVMTLVMVQVAGMKEHGFVGHWKNLIPHGVPWWLIPIMIPVEIMGILAKPFALCVRLFANMTAGHVIILSLLGLILGFGTAFAPVSVAFSLFIFLLELLVAFLQAYIFTMLTALFIGMSVHAH